MSGPMMTAELPKVTGWKGLSDVAHFERLKTALFRTRGRTRFDRAAADRILDDLRHVAYRNGVAAAQPSSSSIRTTSTRTKTSRWRRTT
ncbi:hypothetical protein [Rhizobium leguminosarum]|uniref:hypothetical protein n=1 Tax=Rhizobium leguminosarum TaxID=384 RepID=UPI001C96B1DC|nr:hypothetical protein [Rhizobium leguminosarum]MBY5346038.1 hypothetical protein [Rhizobium leguminosarum]